MTRRPSILHLYVAAVTAAGLACLAWAAVTQAPGVLDDAPPLLWALVAAVVIAELLPINVVLRGQEGELLTSTAFAFAALIAFGPGVAVPALCLGSLAGDLARGKPWVRVAFNVGQYAIGLTVAGALLAAVSDLPRDPLGAFAAADLPPVLLAGAAFFALNTAMVGTVLALASGVPVRGYVASDFVLQASTAGFALGLAPIMVVVGQVSVAMLALLALPVFAIHRNSRRAAVNEHHALHDPLTALPNRVLFHDRVEQALESARRHGTGAAVMVMDLDRFKEINDTLGHYHGDRLLQLVGERITGTLRAEDTVARLGGDEFAILLPSVSDRERAVRVATKVREALDAGFEIDGLSLAVGASIGIATFPADGTGKEALIQRADIAMYVAKADGSGARLYESDQDRRATRRLALAGELRRAVEEDELVLHYQPKVDVATGAVVGAEALARWQHPSLGLLPPDEFVPLAEHTGLITAMTRRVLGLALEQAAAWREQGKPVPVAVNLCARSLLDQQLVDDVTDLLAGWEVDPSLLRLEVTESMIVGDPDRARTVLERLSELGVGVAIDDFGTGYSSLAHLGGLAVDEVKIDRSFVLGMEAEADARIVRSVVALAHSLGLRCVAEGVEDEAALERLRDLGCDLAQGFHVCRPLPAEEFRSWMEGRAAGVPWLPEAA